MNPSNNIPAASGGELLRGQLGFSLVETLVAITVFAIGFLAVISMQSTSIGGNEQARFTTEATILASGQVEFLLNRPYADPLLVDGVGTNPGLTGLDDGLTPGTVPDQQQNSDEYTIMWNIADTGTTAKSIRVIVTRSILLPTPVKLDFVKTSIW